MTDHTHPSRQIAKALDEMYAAALEPLETLRPLLDRLEAEQLARPDLSTALQLEVKRRVAQFRFSRLSEHDLSHDTIDPLYRAACALGFATLDEEVMTDFFFARYCARTSRIHEARGVVDALKRKLDESNAAPTFKTWWSKAADRLLAGMT